MAGGLSTASQLRLLDDFAFNLQAEPLERARRPVTLVDGSEDDMLRLGAALERIPSAYKVEIGDWILAHVMAIPPAPRLDAKTAATYARYLGALARVGARQSLQSSAHEVASIEAAERWLEMLLQLDWKRIEPAGFAAAHIARKTGDRSRDIGAELGRRRLAPAGAAQAGRQRRAGQLGGHGARRGGAGPGQRHAHVRRCAAAGAEVTPLRLLR